MKTRAVLAVLALLALAACHDPDAYVLSPDRADEVLSVTLSTGALPADGIARVEIVAQLDPRTDANKRVVKFTTSAGTLFGGGKEGATVDVTADNTGRAVAELRSSTTPGTARVDVAASTVTRSVSIEFGFLRSVDIFDVAVSDASIPADGFSTSRITVTLRRLGTPQQRLVKFEASAGTLIGPGVTPPRTATVPADADGIASVDIQSDKTIAAARVSITALDTTREVIVLFAATNPDQIIALSLDPSSAPADGATPVLVVAEVAPGLPSGRRTVTFRTTVGRFVPGNSDTFTIDADGSQLARAVLVSAVTGIARVTATVDGTTASAVAEFGTARPDSLFVTAADAELESGDTTQVTVQLLRNVGNPSPRQQVTYTAVTPNGTVLGAFSAITLSNDSGESRATFNLGPTGYTGPLNIRASVGSVTGTARVQVVP